MKVQNESIQALLQQDEAQRKPQTGQAAGFDGLLAEQLNRSAAAQTGVMPGFAGSAQAEQSAAALAVLMQSTTAAGALQEASADLTAEEAAERIGGLLDQWEKYADALSGNDSGVRGIYGMLQGMTQNVRELKAMPGLMNGNADLASLVNELDVLTTTETIKFNRGDYL